MEILIGLILLGIFFFILLVVIRDAIDTSETAENIREIKRLLSEKYDNKI